MQGLRWQQTASAKKEIQLRHLPVDRICDAIKPIDAPKDGRVQQHSRYDPDDKHTQHRAQHLCTMKTEGVRRRRLPLDHRLGKDSDE